MLFSSIFYSDDIFNKNQ